MRARLPSCAGTPAADDVVRRPGCAFDGDPRRWRESPLAQRVFILHNLVMRVGDRLVSDLGLTSARWLLLGVLEKFDQPPTLSELSQDGLLTRQNVSRMVAAMEGEGLVERFTQQGRGRSVFVRMTQHGADVLERAEDAARQFAAGFLPGVSAAEVEQAERLLERLIGNLEAFEKALSKESR